MGIGKFSFKDLPLPTKEMIKAFWINAYISMLGEPYSFYPTSGPLFHWVSGVLVNSLFLICWSPLRVRVLFGLVSVFPFESNEILWVARQAALLCSLVNGHSSYSGLTHPLNIKKTERGISLISKERLYKGLIPSLQYWVIWSIPISFPVQKNRTPSSLHSRKRRKKRGFHRSPFPLILDWATRRKEVLSSSYASWGYSPACASEKEQVSVLRVRVRREAGQIPSTFPWWNGTERLFYRRKRICCAKLALPSLMDSHIMLLRIEALTNSNKLMPVEASISYVVNKLP